MTDTPKMIEEIRIEAGTDDRGSRTVGMTVDGVPLPWAIASPPAVFIDELGCPKVVIELLADRVLIDDGLTAANDPRSAGAGSIEDGVTKTVTSRRIAPRGEVAVEA